MGVLVQWSKMKMKTEEIRESTGKRIGTRLTAVLELSQKNNM